MVNFERVLNGHRNPQNWTLPRWSRWGLDAFLQLRGPFPNEDFLIGVVIYMTVSLVYKDRS